MLVRAASTLMDAFASVLGAAAAFNSVTVISCYGTDASDVDHMVVSLMHSVVPNDIRKQRFSASSPVVAPTVHLTRFIAFPLF
jgi:hypothetical protein